MTAEKTTPPPWEADGLSITARGRGTIARCPRPQDGGVMECMANARMLAAAPKLVEAVAVLGRCGACGGTGKYLNKWVERSGEGKGRRREKTVECSKCEGTGKHPVARSALRQALGTETDLDGD